MRLPESGHTGEPRALKQGLVIGQWRLSKTLGRGGQGEVWEVRHATEKHAPKRAMKICFGRTEKERARFSKEIELLKRCKHGTVLAVTEAISDWDAHAGEGFGQFAYYVSEFCEGSLESASALLGNELNCLTYFCQMAAGVAFLHTLAPPVLHRDIKPANFLFANEPRRLVIADFGIATDESALGDLTATQEVVGSPHFRAPELLSGGVATVQADVFSLGRVLEWMLTGDVSRDLANPRVLSPSDRISSDACAALNLVVRTATSVDLSIRYPTVAAMIRALPRLIIDVQNRQELAVDAVSVTEALSGLDQGSPTSGLRAGKAMDALVGALVSVRPSAEAVLDPEAILKMYDATAPIVHDFARLAERVVAADSRAGVSAVFRGLETLENSRHIQGQTGPQEPTWRSDVQVLLTWELSALFAGIALQQEKFSILSEMLNHPFQVQTVWGRNVRGIGEVFLDVFPATLSQVAKRTQRLGWSIWPEVSTTRYAVNPLSEFGVSLLREGDSFLSIATLIRDWRPDAYWRPLLMWLENRPGEQLIGPINWLGRARSQRYFAQVLSCLGVTQAVFLERYKQSIPILSKWFFNAFTMDLRLREWLPKPEDLAARP